MLADYLRRDVYVLVHRGTGHLCDVTGTRVLGRGSWLLLPAGSLGFGSVSATWLSPPAGEQPLADALQLAVALRDLDPGTE